MTIPADYDALCASFQRSLRAQRKSPKTQATYGEALSQLGAFLATEPAAPSATAGIARAHIEDFLNHLHETGRSPATVNNRYRAIHSFFRWLEEEEDVAHPMAKMKPPDVPVKPVPVLTEDQLRAVLATCNRKTFAGVRDEAIIRTFADTGVRRSELLGMTVSDLDLDLDVVRVIGKFSRERTCPFGRATAVALDRYLRHRARHTYAERPELWLGTRGPLRNSSVGKILRQRGEAAGVTGLHPHQIRHTWAHEFLDDGGEEGDLMRLAGWEGRDMLDRYGASVAEGRARAAGRKHSFGDRL